MEIKHQQFQTSIHNYLRPLKVPAFSFVYGGVFAAYEANQFIFVAVGLSAFFDDDARVDEGLRLQGDGGQPIVGGYRLPHHKGRCQPSFYKVLDGMELRRV